MTNYITRRILIMIPMIFGVIFVVFTIMSISPGDPGRLILGPNAEQIYVDQLNNELGFYDPFFVKFGNYFIGMLKGDFGNSYFTGRPVFDPILEKLPTTMSLALASMAVYVPIGVVLGTVAAVKKKGLIDNVSSVSAMVLTSLPSFWVGLVLMIFFSLHLKWLPNYGLNSWKHYVLPVLTISLGGASGLFRLTRAAVLNVLNEEYVKTARAKGLKESKVIVKHVLRNALMPIITVIGLSLATSLGGTVIIESVFSISGVGLLIIQSIKIKDIPVVMAAVILLSVIFMLMTLIIDLLYALLNPRVRSVISGK